MTDSHTGREPVLQGKGAIVYRDTRRWARMSTTVHAYRDRLQRGPRSRGCHISVYHNEMSRAELETTWGRYSRAHRKLLSLSHDRSSIPELRIAATTDVTCLMKARRRSIPFCLSDPTEPEPRWQRRKRRHLSNPLNRRRVSGSEGNPQGRKGAWLLQWMPTG
jgi:hypothetical protein